MNRISGRILSIGIALTAALGIATAADTLPKADTILDKYIEVTGGKAAYAKLHSETTTGVMDFPAMGMKGKMTAYHVEPDRSFVEIEMPGVGKLQEGTNGDVAWANSAMQGPHVKEGDEKNDAMQQATFNADLRWRDLYPKVETVGLEDVDGKPCYKLVLTPKSGNPVTKWYSKDTGLLVKIKVKAKSPMGEIESESVVSDYRKEGDILMPHKLVSHAASLEMAMTVESVQYNAEIPKDKFELPDEIKALLKKPVK